MKTPHPPAIGSSPQFLTTRWTVVSRAQEPNSPDARAALEQLCQGYWFPLYAYVRRGGRSPHDAQDLTQAFFAVLLEKGYLGDADRDKGRFRTFLLVALKRFLANEWDKGQAQKRGGGVCLVPLDAEIAESKYAIDPATLQPADRDFDRRWAMTLLEQTLAELAREYETLGRSAEFEHLKAYLTADRGSIPYAEIARVLDVGEGGARSAVHRLRKRFREMFRAAVSATVAPSGDVDDEIRHVVRALSMDE